MHVYFPRFPEHAGGRSNSYTFNRKFRNGISGIEIPGRSFYNIFPITSSFENRTLHRKIPENQLGKSNGTVIPGKRKFPKISASPLVTSKGGPLFIRFLKMHAVPFITGDLRRFKPDFFFLTGSALKQGT